MDGHQNRNRWNTLRHHPSSVCMNSHILLLDPVCHDRLGWNHDEAHLPRPCTFRRTASNSGCTRFSRYYTLPVYATHARGGVSRRTLADCLYDTTSFGTLGKRKGASSVEIRICSVPFCGCTFRQAPERLHRVSKS